MVTSVAQRKNLDRAAINVGSAERALSVVAGSGLVTAALGSRSQYRLAAAILGTALVYRGVRGHCAVYETLGVNRAGYNNRAVAVRARHGCKHEVSMLVQRSPGELFALWRDLEHLPGLMPHLAAV